MPAVLRVPPPNATPTFAFPFLALVPLLTPLLTFLPPLRRGKVYQERLEFHIRDHRRHRLLVLRRTILPERQQRVHPFVGKHELTEAERALLTPLRPLHNALQVVPVPTLRLCDGIIAGKFVQTDTTDVLFLLLGRDNGHPRTHV